MSRLTARQELWEVLRLIASLTKILPSVITGEIQFRQQRRYDAKKPTTVIDYSPSTFDHYNNGHQPLGQRPRLRDWPTKAD